MVEFEYVLSSCCLINERVSIRIKWLANKLSGRRSNDCWCNFVWYGSFWFLEFDIFWSYDSSVLKSTAGAGTWSPDTTLTCSCWRSPTPAWSWWSTPPPRTTSSECWELPGKHSHCPTSDKLELLTELKQFTIKFDKSGENEDLVQVKIIFFWNRHPIHLNCSSSFWHNRSLVALSGVFLQCYILIVESADTTLATVSWVRLWPPGSSTQWHAWAVPRYDSLIDMYRWQHVLRNAVLWNLFFFLSFFQGADAFYNVSIRKVQGKYCLWWHCYCELILLLFRDSILYQMKNSAEMTIFSRAGESVKNANMLR